jgi:hypothetical protein
MFTLRGWKNWLSLNANNLVWIALVTGGILFTNFLLINT